MIHDNTLMETSRGRGLRFAAMIKVEEIGKCLAKDHPEIARWYVDTTRPFTCRQIAQLLIPNEYEINEYVAIKAVGYVIRTLLPKKKRERATFLRRSLQFKARFDFTSAEWREHCSRAAHIRIRKGIPLDVTSSLKARGQVFWSDKELKRLVQLARDPHFQRKKRKSRYWARDYERIAAKLNREFHKKKPVRYATTCRSSLFCAKRTFIRRALRKTPII